MPSGWNTRLSRPHRIARVRDRRQCTATMGGKRFTVEHATGEAHYLAPPRDAVHSLCRYRTVLWRWCR